MPIFEYKCIKCNKISEFLELRDSKQSRVCPHCGSSELTKQISVFSAQVKEGQSKKCFGCSDNTCPHSRG
ncbi:MAG: zinc ribbon domain-containing protein [Phycisphaerae bacterium]|nr:zinc ribbon domain-containing protein [Phycisphaerae bacterium]